MNSDKPVNTQNVTIYDIAKESGFSHSTVSRVLNGYEFVKDSTRQSILEAAERMGYVANLQARSLAKGRAYFIGLLVPGLDNGYIGEISRGIDNALAEEDYGLMLITNPRYRTEEMSHVDPVVNGLTAGLILVVPTVPSSYIQSMLKQNFPHVVIDQSETSGPSGSYVDTTNWQGAYTATEYLVKLGHTRIGFITGLMSLRSAVDRLDGYKTALYDNGITVDENLIIEGDYLPENGYTATTQLLKLDNQPTAIMASNDFTAFSAMEASRDHGLEIPEDISIIGFDDIPQARIVHPKLTTVAQPLEKMGRVAVKLLLEHIKDPSLAPKHLTLNTDLVIRNSCAPPKDKL